MVPVVKIQGFINRLRGKNHNPRIDELFGIVAKPHCQKQENDKSQVNVKGVTRYAGQFSDGILEIIPHRMTRLAQRSTLGYYADLQPSDRSIASK